MVLPAFPPLDLSLSLSRLRSMSVNLTLYAASSGRIAARM
ncbi:MAG: hypothetical protein ACD_23C00225G0001 [uncultured bacterium]|nr:MAG: hypothetical protein ACD_23C00225G0001 [uncultured bacterium]